VVATPQAVMNASAYALKNGLKGKHFPVDRIFGDKYK
jgi:hypothetical protein